MDHPAFIGRRQGHSHCGDEGPRLGDQHAPQQGRERRRHNKREINIHMTSYDTISV